ncbi:MAG TPA: phosphotransferase [Gammaproteobacteria bacterium]|nr:phosphotransferase [Gammaproteobacteria bacterium]
MWRQAVESQWSGLPVWVHGDFAAPNLLVRNGRLSGVIDFGQLAAGDLACDLVIAWTFLAGKSRQVFRDEVDLDRATWIRGRGWALWNALAVVAAHQKGDDARITAERTIRHVLEEAD